MKNIFVLTRAEQRAVIVIVMALLAATIAKRFLEDRSHIPGSTSTSTHAALGASPAQTEDDVAAPNHAP
jgi:hypothetical protein